MVPYVRVAFQDPLLDTTNPAFSHLFQITERLGMLATGMTGADSPCICGLCLSNAMCNLGLISLVVNSQLHCDLRGRLGLCTCVFWRLLLNWKLLLQVWSNLC